MNTFSGIHSLCSFALQVHRGFVRGYFLGKQVIRGILPGALHSMKYPGQMKHFSEFPEKMTTLWVIPKLSEISYLEAYQL